MSLCSAADTPGNRRASEWKWRAQQPREGQSPHFGQRQKAVAQEEREAAEMAVQMGAVSPEATGSLSASASRAAACPLHVKPC